MPNRLVNETSPYLRQHAHNPVDWYPWGEEALQKARAEDKPILLSIGYSACHWCHVMERESFEDPAIARQMNEGFVSIKVDREERPDLDAVYMQAVQAMTGRGGWPLTAFLTPDCKPFYGGTYFPPEDRHGGPGFPRVLAAVVEAYHTKRADLTRAADQLVSKLRESTDVRTDGAALTADLSQRAYSTIYAGFNRQSGGFGAAPKFPQPMTHEFVLRSWARTRDPEALEMVEFTLAVMAMGGIYDHLGGGFHRYSTDDIWLVPHFEKMLYDNALLARLYLHAYQATGRPFYRRVAEETLDYVLREMTSPEGGFYSSQDADSEDVEGKFYVWTPRQVRDILGKDGDVFCRYFDVTEQGNFEGQNILHVLTPPDALAREMGVPEDEMARVVGEGRRKLLEARRKRVPPARDDKVLTAWNAMTLRSLAEAAAVLGRDDYRRAAVANASLLLTALRPQGRLLRSYKDGQARGKGYLEDYACLVDGLLALYEATFERRWFDEARSLADQMLELFWEPAQGVFYDTGRDHEALVFRPRDVFDNATPCGGSVAADVLLRLATLTGEESYASRAVAALDSVHGHMTQYPLGLGHWLCALSYHLATPKEIAIIGPRDHPATRALAHAAHRPFVPHKVIAGCAPDDSSAEGDGIPLLKGRGMVNGRPTAYVCERNTCKLPVTDPDALLKQMGE
ncbi:MAG: thioredoxin domain-containing protein [Dehalococcoidia bacterium]|nr:thioredoxin domain-containing protein [Dehalococcoidia bacterium]